MDYILIFRKKERLILLNGFLMLDVAVLIGIGRETYWSYYAMNNS